MITVKSLSEILCCELVGFRRRFLISDRDELRFERLALSLPVWSAYRKNETGIAAFLNGMSDEEIQAMADTYTEGYRIGFAATGKDLSKKTTAQVRYPIGFERMVRAAVKNLEKLNLKVTMRACSSAANKQYDYDHKEDKALYYDKAYVERRLEVMKTSFEEMKKLANGQAGPAVIEVFGEIPFSPETKKEVLKLDEKQQQLSVYDMSMSGQITNQYIIGEERSFTIIAYPVPEIGEKFEEIFAEDSQDQYIGLYLIPEYAAEDHRCVRSG